MRELYKRSDDGKLLYHEAWVHEDKVAEHFGIAGDRGETRYHTIDPGLDEAENVDNALKAAISNGFKDWDDDQSRYLLIEYSVTGFGSANDLQKRHNLQNRMNETLGWTGLGHCDGGSIGSGTMEVCCIVVDFELARNVIEGELRHTEFGDYSRIYDVRAD